MRILESVHPDGGWASVELLQVTLIALLGCLAWLAARRGGPALRGAILTAALLGLLFVPAVSSLVPVWLPLPEWVSPVGVEVPPSNRVSEATPSPSADPAVFALLVAQPSDPALADAEDPIKQAGESPLKSVKAEAVVINLAPAPEDAANPIPPANVLRPSLPLTGLLAALWALGAAVWLSRALVRLVLLYRCAGQARPIRDSGWTAGVESLAKRHELKPVALRESPAIASPLTLGLLRPLILLPRGWRNWSAEQRGLILEHEMAHIQRRDFLAGLVAELAVCLCWFHPLVRWLAGRLRLEQEYAADAWVASATADPKEYVQCLARLALELDQGVRRPLAPAFWRRRPEILRRIDMLRRNPKGLPSRLGKRAGWTVAVLTAAACLAAGGVGTLHSAADGQKTSEAVPEAKDKATADRHGDPLPVGALARLGTSRMRHGAEVTFVAYGPGGKTLLTAGRDNTIRLWDLASGKEVRRFAPPKPAKAKPPGGKAQNDKANVEVMFQLMAGGGNKGGSLRIAVTADGKTLAVARGNIIQLYDVETGASLHQIQGTTNGFAGLLFSPDGRTLAARGGNDTLFLWATDSGKELHQIKSAPRPRNRGFVLILGGGGDADAPGMAFTPDGKTLAAAATDYKEEAATKSVKFWDLATGKEIRRIKTPENLSVVAIAPGGEVVAYSSGNVVHLCEVKTGKELRQIKTNAGRIVALSFAADGKTLAIRGRNQRVGLWETQTGKELHQLSDAQATQRTGGLVFLAGGFSSPESRSLALSPDGKQVASASGSTVRLWETATGKEVLLSDGHRKAPSTIALSKDGQTVVSWGGDRVVRRWEASTGKQLSAFPAPAGTTRAALSKDGQTVALANADDTIRLHDTATGKELHRLKAHANGTAALAFAPDGKMLASRSSAGNSIRLYDVAEGRELRQIAMRPGRDSGRQGTVLIFGGGGGSGGTGAGLAFSPDGKLLVAPGPDGRNSVKTLVFFDVATGKELRKIESPQPITSLTFSPDGRTLATENADRSISLWEVASGKKRAQLGEPTAEQSRPNGGRMVATFVVDGIGGGGFSEPAGPVGLVFSPDGRALAARGSDLAVRVWDVNAGKEIGQLKGHSGRIATVAFAPGGKTLASGATDTTILLWDAAKPLKELAPVQAVELPAAEVETLWGHLAGDDAAQALRGVLKLTTAPRQTVPFLSERLKPAARIAPQKIDGWIGALDSEKYAVRQEAAANLLKTGEQVVPALRKVLASSPPLETRKRVEELLQKLTGGTWTAEQLRLIRSVETLERIGTPKAQQVLRTLTQGAPGALPTREAAAALNRLAGSPAPRP